MSYKLIVYSSKAFRQYFLPAITDADYSVYFDREILPYVEDSFLRLENVDNTWRILASENYIAVNVKTKEDYVGKILEDQDQVMITFQGTGAVTIQFAETEQSFASYTKYSLQQVTNLTIGYSAENDISFSGSNFIDRKVHAVLRKEDQYWFIENCGKNGIFVNGFGTREKRQLKYGDHINIFGLSIVFLKDIIAVNDSDVSVNVRCGALVKLTSFIKDQIPEKQDSDGGKIKFHRAPRQIYKIEDDVIDIEAPPQPKLENKRPLAMIIGPSMTMTIPMLLGSGMAIVSSRISGNTGSAFMFTGIITAASSALLGVMWTILNLRYEKKRIKEEELHRFEAYGEYLIKCSTEIKEKYERNTEHLQKMYPDAAVCCSYNADTVELWNRNANHLDYLTYRLGIGDIPFQVKINIPKERFTMVNDSLAEKPKMIKDSFSILTEVPVCVDLLKHHLVGIVGGKGKKGALEVFYNLVCQIAVSNSYTDVKLVFLYDEQKNENSFYDFAKWLPHVWSEDKKTRFVAANKNEAGDVLYEVTKALRIRMENMKNSFEKIILHPYYILFAASPDLLEGELIASYVYGDAEACGLSTIMLAEHYEELPNACDYIIENDENYKGMYSVTDSMEERTEIRYDSITARQLEWLARTLNNIEVNESEKGGDMPNSLTFFEMYGINRLEELQVADRWRKNRTYESMKALVGQKAGGANCYLDVHEKYHGPHGLVAGTTGSGKSETLQTYLLSLALNFSPDDVGFFLIDYKGGGMANLFDGLPHVIGQISNLSGNQVRRAMVSIKSENKRRQRIFNEHDVNNINLYTRLYKNKEASVPIPHMFIVIDEFAELKREEPEFMKELISVAQVGRSLGVHLILATQKPSGTVDDNIWSNSKFRLCLRVQDKQDSNDMLHRPEAAYITQAGRCYLQVGNDELFELFQSGYSGAVYDAEADNIKTDIVSMLDLNGKAAMVGNHLKKERKDKAKLQWISSLLCVVIDVLGTDKAVCMELCSNEFALPDCIAKIFDKLAAAGIDYPENEYNAKRMKNLITVFSAVDITTENVSKCAEAVIRFAEINRIKLPEMKEKTQLNAVVEYLAKIANENGYAKPLQLWLPVLKTQIYLSELEGTRMSFDGHSWGHRPDEWNLQVSIGTYDDPVNQSQNDLIIDFARNGHHVLAGLAGSGKSTFVQSLVYALVNKYTPDEINIYALDYSAKMMDAMKMLPHIGGIIYEGEEDKLDKFFVMMEQVIEERKKLFQGGNFSQYIRANGKVLPAILITIDNFSNFKGKAVKDYDDKILQILKEGTGLGIFTFITCAGFGSLELPNRIAEHIRTSMTLEMNDKFQYGEILRMTHLDIMPEVNIKGRGLARVGEEVLEYQTALSIPAEDDFVRMEKLRKMSEAMRRAWTGRSAKAIPVIPEKPIWEEFSKLEEVRDMAATDRFLPIGYDAQNAAIYGIDLSQTYCYLIAGKGRTGKSNLLKVAASAAVMRKGSVTLIDFGMKLTDIAEQLGADIIDTDQKMFDFFKKLTPDFVERNKNKKEAKAEHCTEEEIYMRQLSFAAQFIIISDLADFIAHVYRPAAGIGNMNGGIEEFLDKGAFHNIFWFACFNPENNAQVIGKKVYDFFIRDRKGIYLGGNVLGQRIFDFGNIPFTEQGKVLKPGIGLISSADESADRIIVPLYS